MYIIVGKIEKEILEKFLVFSNNCVPIHVHVHVHVCVYGTCTCTCISEFLICLEVWAKLAQQWLVCAPLGIHLEPINKELILLVII